MENLKVKVKNEAESIEVQELFFELGFEWFGTKREIHEKRVGLFFTTRVCGVDCLTYDKEYEFDTKNHKELTIPELCDLVVLKRNDVNDATHTDQDGWKWYIGADSYVWQAGNSQQLKQWDQSSLAMVDLEPVKKEMKEFLDTVKNYTLVVDTVKRSEDWIEVPPSGVNSYNYLYKNGINLAWTEKPTYHYGELLWQRSETEYLMQGANGERLMESVGQLKDSKEKHSHYKKDVSHLDFIDPYRIAQLYDLHPCADHIAKKALCTGKRGHKDLIRDIQDIIDTAERWKQMIQEDQNAI